MHINYKWKYLGVILLLLSGYFILYNFQNPLRGHTLCIFKNVTGYPCPACGSTRATILLLHGQFFDSIMLNPLGVITNTLIFISILWMLFDVFKGKNTFYPFLKRDWNWKIKTIVFILLAVNWIWNIEKGL